MSNTTPKHPDSDLIDRLGGTTKAAEFFKVSAPSISEWRITGLPKARMMYLELARPDLFLPVAPVKEVRRKTNKRQPNSTTN